MARTNYSTLKTVGRAFDLSMVIHAAVIVVGLAAVWHMEHYGHIVTGMSNKIVWGMPHVFAIFLIIAASGALNVASISSVFSKKPYKPFARLSGLLALSLLIGGLSVLVLDLGRPDRLIIAMTTYNFKSIFAWNIFLYTGFMAIVVIYLYTMMAKYKNRFTPPVGFLAFVWRLVLTAGTGSIFGFIVARSAYDSALFAPLFIASSFVYGLAFTVVILKIVQQSSQSTIVSTEMISRFRNLLMTFTASVLLITIIFHLTKLYATQYHPLEEFLLAGNNIYTLIFWAGQIFVGTITPIFLMVIWHKSININKLAWISGLLLLGGIAQIYVILIGGQAYPIELFPGMEISSSFQDGEIVSYTPSLPEILLGLSGISIAMLLSGILLRIMPFLPKSVTA
ncbi:MAG: polysulfide reductase NrfD [Hyphomicrobiales bacterium]|nr:polysulfide reductase NrfD [Hyphomicrobiales bacterium]